MIDPQVSVVVVPRERAGLAVSSLEALLEHTAGPYELVYVDGSLTRAARREVRARVEGRGHRYLRSDDWLYPNQARNLGLAASSAPYVVFVDNDVFPEPGWLEALVACAEETGAGVVSPLYLEGGAEAPRVHCAGGEICRVSDSEGPPTLLTRQHELGLPLTELGELERGPTGLCEFHCVLVRRDFLERIGGLDDALRTTREHVDLCLLAEREGFAIYLEPRSRVRYDNEEPFQIRDLDYFMFRWSRAATEATITHFEGKWRVRLDARRREIIARRRQRIRAKGDWVRPYAYLWHLCQWLPPARGALHWLHRSFL